MAKIKATKIIIQSRLTGVAETTIHGPENSFKVLYTHTLDKRKTESRMQIEIYSLHI